MKVWIVLAMFLVAVIVGALIFEATAEFWISHFRGEKIEIPFVLCCVGGLVTSPVLTPVAIFTWIYSIVT